MRIAYITSQYPPDGIGGIGTYVRTVATVLAEDGHDVTVICATRDQRRSSTVEYGVRVERFPAAGPAWLWKRVVLPRQTFRVRIHAAVSSAWALWRLGRRFDVIEAPEWKAQGLLLAAARRGPVVVHIHLPIELEQAWNGTGPSRGRRLSFVLERWTVAKASARTATSRQSTLGPGGEPWVPEHEVEVVTPPVRAERWAKCPSVLDTGPIVLFVGRLERRKAPELLVEAMAQLADDMPQIRAVFVGRPMNRGGQSYAVLLESLAAQRGVAIELRPPVTTEEQMLELYGSARVVAVPSRFETLSMVTLEALACGRPVVMTDGVGASEWIADALPELVVPNGDAGALAAALRPHLTDPGHAQAMGERGQRLVAELCSDRNVVDSRIDVYRAVSGG